MFFVMLALLPLLQAAEPPAREPAGFASGWAAIPRSMWLSNYSHAYGAAKTIMVAGPTEDTIVAYNSAQSWSPAHGVVNGSFVRMTFGSQEIRGKLLPNGFIVWENGSRWLKERSATARSANPSGSAPNRSRLPPAVDESYSYSCAARPAPAGLPRAKRHAHPHALSFPRQTKRTRRTRTHTTGRRLQEGASLTRTSRTNLARPCGSNYSPREQQRTPHVGSLVSASRTRVQRWSRWARAGPALHRTQLTARVRAAACSLHRAPSPVVRGALRRRGGGGIGQGQAGKASQGQVQDDKCKAADGTAQQAKVCQQGPPSEVTLIACKV